MLRLRLQMEKKTQGGKTMNKKSKLTYMFLFGIAFGLMLFSRSVTTSFGIWFTTILAGCLLGTAITNLLYSTEERQ